MTGFETGTRDTGSGAGYWLFMANQASVQASTTIIENIVKTLVQKWNVNVIRMPICGSGWLQNYNVRGYGGFPKPVPYRDWIDIAVCEAVTNNAVVLLDVHLWAIGKETNTTRNAGMEDGCTGINRVDGTDSCAPHDWYGQYTSLRTGKTYNQEDNQDNWECAIANADGCTLDNLFRAGNDGVQGTEHFYNLWYELALRYKDVPNVFFELYNEPYQRQSADFGTNCAHGVCPPGVGFGDNIDESQYAWDKWSELMDTTIRTIRDDAKATNIIITNALDWSYDWLGKGGTKTGGPIARPQLLPWVGRNVPNIAYALHPYQHGSCCGQIGQTEDLSVNDPYESAFCQYPPFDHSGQPVASHSPVPIANTVCDSTGYATTQNKKSPPCTWAPNAIIPPTPPSPPPSPPTPPCQTLTGMNLGGHDIVHGDQNLQPAAAYCCHSCDITPGCIGWTYVTGNQQCWLKDKIDSPHPDGSVISGYSSVNNTEKIIEKRWIYASGVCAGDKDTCSNLTESQCKAVDWASPSAGGWSKYVLPMAQYGPIIASEHGSFDCSSAFEYALTSWMSKFGVSYTAWALWPQNSGGPGQGACGYPSIMVPSSGFSDGFGKGTNNCDTLDSCSALLQPLGWSGKVVFNDIQKNVKSKS
jgi:hypothetical protein